MIDKKQFPIFCGRVLSIPAIIEQENEVWTLVDYLTIKDEPTEQEARQLFTTEVLGIGESKKDELEKRIQRATVPMRLDPSVLVGADIRTRYSQMPLEEGENAPTVKTYELEIIKGALSSGGDVFAAMAAPKHTGMRYIRVL